MAKLKIDGRLSSWMDQQARGRADRRRARPRRDTLLVREAARRCKLRIMCEVSFWNPLHTGKMDDLNGGLQWIDIVASYKDHTGHARPLYILIDYQNKRWKDYEKRAWDVKQKHLKTRGDVLVLPERRGSQEYWILITRHIQKLNRERQTLKELGY